MTENGDWDRFDEVITSEAQLESITGTPIAAAIDKVNDHLDEISRAFVASSPFCLVATANTAGFVDASPKGDPAGFVRVLDDRHLAIPDRPGNRRTDSFHNLLTDDRVGMVFLVPGTTETLRVSGRARIVRDAGLLEAMAVKGRQPALALVVEVDRVMIHCPKCMIRSKLWRHEGWADAALPGIGETMVAHANSTSPRRS